MFVCIRNRKTAIGKRRRAEPIQCENRVWASTSRDVSAKDEILENIRLQGDKRLLFGITKERLQHDE